MSAHQRPPAPKLSPAQSAAIAAWYATPAGQACERDLAQQDRDAREGLTEEESFERLADRSQLQQIADKLAGIRAAAALRIGRLS